ncbi:MAG: sulfotransferase [Cyclobacteriaceae bacterium]
MLLLTFLKYDQLKPVRLPLPIRLWNTFGSVVPSNLSRDALMKAASNETGLTDFGDEFFIEPLDVLLTSIQEEARLHRFGKFVIRKRMIGLLTNRLKAQHFFKMHPEILDIELEPPIVIAGLQRTGTTFLQRLLAIHPNLRPLLSWEALNPAPFLNWQRRENDPRLKESKKAVEGLKYINPKFFAIHPIEYDVPEEEILLLDISFMSTVAEATMHVPTYSDWLVKQDHTPAYEYMKKLLQLLTWQKTNNSKRWVLKTPHHLEYLDVLRKVFPGCTIIQTHRDPLITVPSLCSMIWHGRFIFSNDVDATDIGRHWFAKIQRMVEESTEFRSSVQSEGFIDLDYKDLIAEPISAVQGIFSKTGLVVDDELITSLDSALKSNHVKKYGTHRYELKDFGLTEEEITKALS